MLPLHGQGTAAIKNIHWAGSITYFLTSDNVFDIQSRYVLPSSFSKVVFVLLILII